MTDPDYLMIAFGVCVGLALGGVFAYPLWAELRRLREELICLRESHEVQSDYLSAVEATKRAALGELTQAPREWSLQGAPIQGLANLREADHVVRAKALLAGPPLGWEQGEGEQS